MSARLTDDGVQLTQIGYLRAIEAIENSLLEHKPVRLEISANGKIVTQQGVSVSHVTAADQRMSFVAKCDTLPLPAATALSVADQKGTVVYRGNGVFRIDGLSIQQKYLLSGSNEFGRTLIGFISNGNADEVGAVAELGQAEQLRQLIVAKNADYFNYWRHENDTYILGYRKHEQGKNAVEFPEWVKLTEEKDKEIAKLRVPQPVTYTLARDEKAGK